MELDTKDLRPGMVLNHDVNGKTGRPIVTKDTVLTEVEIEFIQQFLIEKVDVSMPQKSEVKQVFKKNGITLNDPPLPKKDDSFLEVYSEVVQQFKRLFTSWQGNVPVNMYDVRELCLPLFQLIETKSLPEIKSLLAGRFADLFYYKAVAVSLLSIKLAQLMNFEKKEWLQIGFAAILIDIGLAKSELAINSHQADIRHPALSYDMIKDEATLTQHAKLAIVQHHERLDGSGFPLKITAERIHPYARIIAVSDRYFSLYVEKEREVDHYMLKETDTLSANIIDKLVGNNG